MERTYSKEAARRRSTSGRWGHSRSRKRVSLAPRERRRLIQLVVCTALFLAVFLGRGIFPERLEALRGELLEVIRTDTDFRSAFANLGRAVDRGEPVAETLASLWEDVFTAGGGLTPYVFTMEHTPLYQEERAAFSVGGAERMARMLGLETGDGGEESHPSAEHVQKTESSPTETTPVEAVEPPPPTAAQSTYDGPPLPDNATMEKRPLGLEETTAPVMAVVSSNYGWREHPIKGGEKFHNGVDLAASYGEPIGAFADGVVDYIGESPAYGQYLQIKHAGGVTSFYAHCSKLCVQPGQQVSMGETVAEVGDTGEVTAAHLHFELRLDGILLDPLYYIETE